MQEESNLRAFWATLDKLKDMTSPKPRTEETIPAKEWLNHFKELGNCYTNFRLREEEARELIEKLNKPPVTHGPTSQ